MEKIVKKQSNAKTIEDFINLEHLNDALAARASFSILTVNKMIDESDAHEKTKTNDLFARDIVRMSQHHMLYLTFRVSMLNLEPGKVKDPNLVKVLTLLY